MLYEFVAANREEIIRRCRVKVATRSVPPPTEAEINHGVPLFLDQLVKALHLGQSSSPEIGRSAILHGHDLLRQGFTVSQVVHDYGDVCQSITELAHEMDGTITNGEFRLLNACLDNAIAFAVTQFGGERNQATIDSGHARENERLGFLAHELRNLIHTAMLALEVVKAGNVGIAGSTGTVLHQSLVRARDLIARSLAEVQLTQGIQQPQQFLVSGFLEELLPAATLAAHAEGLTLAVMPVEAGVTIEADRQVLSAVMMNVLQNAFKFTRAGTKVIVRMNASSDRVHLEVEDQCGGLSTGDTDDLFRPFLQRNANRTGVGLGLAFSRWAVEANHGQIYARSLPNVGCVFTIDLPRVQVPALALS